MRFLATFVALLAMLSGGLAKDDLQVGDFVKQYLNSIGTEQARAAVKNRASEGTMQFHMQHQGGSADGKEVFVSDGNKLVSLLKLPNPS
jgi:hypothetical protein